MKLFEILEVVVMVDEAVVWLSAVMLVLSLSLSFLSFIKVDAVYFLGLCVL